MDFYEFLEELVIKRTVIFVVFILDRLLLFIEFGRVEWFIEEIEVIVEVLIFYGWKKLLIKYEM